MSSGRQWVSWVAGVAALGLAVAFVGAWLVTGLRGGPGAREAPPVLFDAPEFALVDHWGDTLRAAELRGTTWVASFFFTNCEAVCPLITARMAELRDSLATKELLGREVRLISITVDPARDSVAALRQYAARYGGSPPSEWAFLTGTPAGAVRRLIEEGFKVAALLPAGLADSGENYQVQHTSRLLLVDPQGRVRSAYDTTEPDALDRLRADLARIQRGGP